VEYFKTLKGAAPVSDLMDGINLSWNRTAKDQVPDIIAGTVKNDIEKIIASFSHEHPEKSVADLVKLYDAIDKITNSYWKEKKLQEIKKIIENCSGLFMEAVAGTQYAVLGDSLKITLTVNNRAGANILNAGAHIDTAHVIFDQLKKNTNTVKTYAWFIQPDAKLTQPYWLENEMNHGSFNVTDQQLIGKAENDPLSVNFSMMIEGKEFVFAKPVRYKYTDPVKGEIYQPVNIIPAFSVTSIPEISINISQHNEWEVKSFKDNNRFQRFIGTSEGKILGVSVDTLLNKNQTVRVENVFNWDPVPFFGSSGNGKGEAPTFEDIPYANQHTPHVKVRSIVYDHIPSITYTKKTKFTLRDIDLNTSGSLAGYIPGAGDKIPDALEQMGYKVITLKETDITPANLKQFDVIITGVRAYNTNDWMNNVYSTLMQYVKDGGVLFTQYNTNNFISNIKSKIGPFDFTISRNRITDEEAKVNFLLPNHPALNYPNKITEKDFEGWIQERSIYHADNIDSNYKRILSMKDPGEKEQDGSLIIANYGKGKFVYSGLVFFRELPAGVPGAYRLFANLISKPNTNAEKMKTKNTKPVLLKPKAANSKRVN
jgi:hypothetical protein